MYSKKKKVNSNKEMTVNNLGKFYKKKLLSGFSLEIFDHTTKSQKFNNLMLKIGNVPSHVPPHQLKNIETDFFFRKIWFIFLYLDI